MARWYCSSYEGHYAGLNVARRLGRLSGRAYSREASRAALTAIRDGAAHVNEVKAWTRAGMGRCQGRMCGPALAHLVAAAKGSSVADAGVFTPRPPVKPVPLEVLAAEVTR